MPSLNLYDMISFKNICKEKILCRYNYSENHEDHWLEPGRVYSYPRLVADLFRDNIVDQYINEHEGERGMNINNTVMRNKIWTMVTVSEQPSQLPGVQTLEQMALNEAKKLNTAEPTVAPTVQGSDIPPALNTAVTTTETETFDGLKDEPEKPRVVPDHDTLLSFAVNTLKMSVDEKLLKTFTKTPEEIALKLGYYEHTA